MYEEGWGEIDICTLVMFIARAGLAYFVWSYLWRVPCVTAYTAFSVVRLVLPSESSTIQLVIVVIWWRVESIPLRENMKRFGFIPCRIAW